MLMRNHVRFGILAAVALAVATTFLLDGTAQDAPKHTIKDVMKKAHKEGLLKTVAGGKASKEEKDMLVEMYTSLSLNKPPKGDLADWKTRTETMLTNAKDAAKDAKGAGAKLQKSVDCKTCHSMHKG